MSKTAPAAATATAPPAPVAHPVVLMDLARIRESPFNPRLVFHPAEMAEMEASIRQRGLLQPYKVRPVKKAADGTDHEVVWGHRRHRGSVAAGLTKVPVMVVQMLDDDVVDEQLIENHQRQDIHPLEEADQFRLLNEKFKRPVWTDPKLNLPADQIGIANRIGLSKEYVYARMKLCALGEAGRKAFLAGKLSTSTALLVARIPNAQIQAAAVKELVANAEDGPLGARQVSAHLQQRYMLRLAQAPFDIKDAKLVEKAGACPTCPKNSASERALFADVDAKAGDMCTDPGCYQSKCDADFARKAAAAKTAGAKVIDDAKAKDLFYGDGRVAYNAPVVDLDATCERDPKGRTYRKLLAGVKDLPVMIARDPQRKAHELIDSKAVDGLLKKAGHEFKVTGYQMSAAEKERQRRAVLEAELTRAGNSAVLAAVVDKAGKGEADERFLRLILGTLIQGFGLHDGLADATRRRGLWQKGKRPEQILQPQIASMKGPELRGWIVELVCARFGTKGSSPHLYNAAKVYGLDAKALADAGKKALREKKAAKAKGKPPAKAKATASAASKGKPAAKGKTKAAPAKKPAKR